MSAEELGYGIIGSENGGSTGSAFHRRVRSGPGARWFQSAADDSWQNHVAIRYKWLSILDPHGRGGRSTDRIVFRHLLCLREANGKGALELQHPPGR